MLFGSLTFSVLLLLAAVFAENHSYQACVDKYSGKGYSLWQEWSDHYACCRYRCEIRDGKYYIAAVWCRKPKIPEKALECHEYIEDENVEFPTCCSRLRCIVEIDGERVIQIRGQPGELFINKPWKVQNELNPALADLADVRIIDGGSLDHPIPNNFNSRVTNKRGKVLLGVEQDDAINNKVSDFQNYGIE